MCVDCQDSNTYLPNVRRDSRVNSIYENNEAMDKEVTQDFETTRVPKAISKEQSIRSSVKLG